MTYIPALGHDFLTPLYDALVRLTMPERRLRRRVVELARLQPGQHALDLGCGTGTLALMMKRARPDAEVIGLDGDPKILEIARRKPGRVRFLQGLADDIPLPPSSLDVVTSTLVFHHLPAAVKRGALREIFRVLRPAAFFVLADWGPPRDATTRLLARTVRWLDGETTADNFAGRLPGMMLEAGFSNVAEARHERTLYGIVDFHVAMKGDTR